MEKSHSLKQAFDRGHEAGRNKILDKVIYLMSEPFIGSRVLYRELRQLIKDNTTPEGGDR